MKTQKKLLFFCLIVSLCCVLFAFSASAATTMDEYVAENSGLDYTAYEALTDDQKAAFDTAFVVASESYANLVDQELLDVLANAAKVLSYEGLQTRYEGIPGIRSMYVVDANALNDSIVAYGAIMAIADASTGNTSSNLAVAYDEEAATYIATGSRAAAHVAYANGEAVGNYLNATKTQFAYTTTYKVENQTCRNMHEKELVYRGFVVVKFNDVEYIVYVDGVGDTFGAADATYGAATSMLEMATYYADTYPDSETLATVRSADEYAWAPSKMPTLTAAGELAYVCAGCGNLATTSKTMELPQTAGADEVAETVAAIEGETNKFTVTASEAGIYKILIAPKEGSYQTLYNETVYSSIVRVKQAQTNDGGYPVYLQTGDNVICFSGTATVEETTVVPLFITEPAAVAIPDVSTDANVEVLTNKVWNFDGKKLEIATEGFYKLSAFVSAYNTCKITDFTLTTSGYSTSFVPNLAVNASDNEYVADGSTRGTGFQNLGLVYLKAGTYSISITPTYDTGANNPSVNMGALFATKLDVAHTCEYEKTVSGTTFTYACPICGDVKGVVEFTEPTVETPDEIEITLDEAGKTFVVPAESVAVSGFYEVILKHVAAGTSANSYTTLVNDAYPAFISRNRDRVALAGEYSTERVFTVYLKAHENNAITYSGDNITGAKLTLRDAVSLDLAVSAVDATYTKSGTASQGKIVNGLYEFRGNGVLTYASTLTIASEGFYRIGGNMNCASSNGTFTFTDANGNAITAALDATNNDAKKDGSTSAVYAKNIGLVYLPAGEYTVSFKLGAGVITAAFGSLVFEALEHNHDVTVEYNTPATCTTPGLTGTGCIVCGEGATVIPAGHDFQNTVLDGDANLVSAANCAAAATYWKVCSVCGEYSDDTFTVGEAGTHVYELAIKSNVAEYTCVGCGDVKNVDLTYPSADVADFSIDVTDFAGTITVPAANITASGFYWVTLEGTTKMGSGYANLYNNANGRLYASQNRDQGDGSSYSVYLEAGEDNVLTYGGTTLTKANFKLAEPTSAGTIMITSGKDDLTANTVTNAAFKNGDNAYQMRAGSILSYTEPVTVTKNGFFTIGAAVRNATAGKVIFTFTNAAGDTYEASFMCSTIASATGITILAGGSESYCYAADLAAIYLPAGEYSLTVSLSGGDHMVIGVITMNPIAHDHDVTVEYNTPATCTTPGMIGTGCIVCGEGATITPAGHSWDDGVVTEPSCVADGATLYTCTVCSDTKIDNVVPPTGHKWDDANDAVCNACGIVRKYSITPTFETTDNKTWTITVPGSQIQATGIYRLHFKTEGTWSKQYMTLASSNGVSVVNRFKDTTVDADGYTMWWYEAYIVKADNDEDGNTDDVTLTFSAPSAQGNITEMKLDLLAEVVAMTSTKPGKTNGSFASVAAGDYTVVAFFNAYNGGAVTVTVGESAYTVGTAATNGNLVGGGTHYDGSTNTAHFMNMGEISFAEDATDIVVSTAGSGQFITTGGNIPVFITILAEEIQ